MAKILLIEDEPLVRLGLAKLLEVAGHKVTEAENGVAGVEAYAAARPDLVLTDVVMPEKEGLETIVDLRRRFPEVKIIAMSGGGRFGNYSLLEYAAALGAHGALRKPFDGIELLGMIDALLAVEADGQ
jgi:YesN/AraC family two-component response regulator